MTFLDKAKEINPTIDEEKILNTYCPCSFDLEDDNECYSIDRKKCVECWNREMPNAETKEELFIDFKGELDTAYNKGLEDGRNEVWEFVRNVFTFNNNKMEKVFGFVEKRRVFDDLTTQEALAKLKAYEEEKSKVVVGDVIKTVNGECEYIVTRIEWSGRRILHVMNRRNGTVQTMTCDVVKTGKHIDIQSILSQIGGE